MEPAFEAIVSLNWVTFGPETGILPPLVALLTPFAALYGLLLLSKRTKALQRTLQLGEENAIRNQLIEGMKLLDSEGATAQTSGIHLLKNIASANDYEYAIVARRAVAALLSQIDREKFDLLPAEGEQHPEAHKAPKASSIALMNALEFFGETQTKRMREKHDSNYKVQISEPYLGKTAIPDQFRLDYVLMTNALVTNCMFLGCTFRFGTLVGDIYGTLQFKGTDLTDTQLILSGEKASRRKVRSWIFISDQCKISDKTTFGGTPLVDIPKPHNFLWTENGWERKSDKEITAHIAGIEIPKSDKN